MYALYITYYDANQIPSAHCGQETNREGDSTNGQENIGDIILEHIKGVLEDLLPGWVNQPRGGSLLNCSGHNEIPRL